MHVVTRKLSAARTARLLLAGAVLSIVPALASAQGVTGLFNTGVDGSGVKLAGGAVDSHYQVVENGFSQAFVVNNATPYVPDAASAYIWQQADGTPVNVTRTFRTTFTISAGYNPLTASISGQWSTDNAGLDILVNGVSSGNTSAGFTSFTGFSISGAAAGFVVGLNTLDFQVKDVGVIAALDVRELSGSAKPVTSTVPEPSSIALMAMGIAVIGVMNSRRKRA